MERAIFVLGGADVKDVEGTRGKLTLMQGDTNLLMVFTQLYEAMEALLVHNMFAPKDFAPCEQP